jgi:streptogramin lyase
MSWRSGLLLGAILGLCPAPLVGGAEPSGWIDTVAGTGQPGHTGDGGPALKAQLNQPFACALDGRGHLFIAEAGSHCIRRLDLATGRIETVVGTGQKGFGGDGGPATKALLNEPYAVAVAADDTLYIVDRLNTVVRKVDGETGIITTLAGTPGRKGYAGDGDRAALALFREPNDCCLDGAGSLLIADVADWRIRRLDLTSGAIATFAGVGPVKGKLDRQQLGNGGPAPRAVLVGARAVCVDGHGNTFICEREGNAVRWVNAQGFITTIGGTGAKGYTGDGGLATQATFNGPKGICCDRQGNVYVVDTENHAIRRILAQTDVVTTVAGGRKGSGGDGGAATQASLDRPHGCVVDADGTLYIADTNTHRVRRVRFTR